MQPQRTREVPLWAVTAEPAPPTPALRGSARADVAIVGAGILGLSAALHVAERGGRVVVAEAGEIGSGASGRNAGRVLPDFVRNSLDDVRSRFGRERGDRLARLVAGGGELVFDLVRRHSLRCDAVQSGWITAAHAHLKMRRLEREFDRWRELGRDLTLLDRDETARLTGSESFYGGLLDPTGGHLNPLGYARGLARAAIDAGAAVHTASPALDLERTGSRWRVKTPGGSVEADRVFLCTNGMMDRLAPAVTRSVLPLEVYEMATEPLDMATQRRLLPGGHVVSDTRNAVFAYHLDRSGRLLTGSITPRIFGATERVQREGERHIRRRLRMKLDADIAFVWHGTITRLLDSLPRLFEVAPGVVAPIACNGRGIAKTTAVGRLCADLASGASAADLPLPLTPPRPIPLHGLLAWLHPYAVSLSALQDHLTP